MMILIITIHVIICIVLIALVLIQRGRGGGLVDSFQGVESMFGTKTNAFLTRTTTVLSILFFFTCLSLAVLSVKRSKSLMQSVKPKPVSATTLPALGEPEKQGAEKQVNIRETAPAETQSPKEEKTQTEPKN